MQGKLPIFEGTERVFCPGDGTNLLAIFFLQRRLRNNDQKENSVHQKYIHKRKNNSETDVESPIKKHGSLVKEMEE
jgi:hypothetical protein